MHECVCTAQPCPCAHVAVCDCELAHGHVHLCVTPGEHMEWRRGHVPKRAHAGVTARCCRCLGSSPTARCPAGIACPLPAQSQAQLPMLSSSTAGQQAVLPLGTGPLGTGKAKHIRLGVPVLVAWVMLQPEWGSVCSSPLSQGGGLLDEKYRFVRLCLLRQQT